MSPRPPSLSSDLQRLEDDGYGLGFQAGHLLVGVPYVNSQREVKWGRLISALELAGDQTQRPDIHVAYFVGETVDDYPCDSAGNRLEHFIHQPGPVALGSGLTATCGFSRMPRTPGNVQRDYVDYYEKMSTYVGLLQAEAQAIDPTVSYRDHPPMSSDEEGSVFRYEDTASSRARIGAVVDRIRRQKIAIVGLGGSGSYVLDAVAKTPVAEIHLFDDDLFLTHNAFRAPGAASLEELNERPTKVDHFQAVYGNMHLHVVAHPERVLATNASQLAEFDFVFISVDAGPDKRAMFEALQAAGRPFADTGMGVYQVDTSIGGVVRTSVSTPAQADPAWMTTSGEISFTDDADDDYRQNIQIAELNMLNAALAVMAWKKYFGFYLDFQHERSSEYTIDGNHMLNIGAAT